MSSKTTFPKVQRSASRGPLSSNVGRPQLLASLPRPLFLRSPRPYPASRPGPPPRRRGRRRRPGGGLPSPEGRLLRHDPARVLTSDPEARGRPRARTKGRFRGAPTRVALIRGGRQEGDLRRRGQINSTLRGSPSPGTNPAPTNARAPEWRTGSEGESPRRGVPSAPLGPATQDARTSTSIAPHLRGTGATPETHVNPEH